MEKIEDNIDRFLPFGQSLHSVLQHPSIKDKERRELLRLKGVFLASSDEDSTFPILTASLLSPYEFEYLKENLQVKEDREKISTRTLNWESDKTLIAAIPSDFNIQRIIRTSFPKYEVIGSPTFRMIEKNPNRLILDFKCETANHGKAWYRGKNVFAGQVTLERKIVKNKKVELQIVHTSPETIDIANKVAKNLELHFKSQNYMNPKKEIFRILFNNFSNEERIAFFLKLTEGNETLQFEKATYLDIGPDPAQTLPEGINWMEASKVKDLSINGETLHQIHFIKNNELHQFLELAEMEIIYNFSLPSAEGNCRIRFGFPNYFTRRIGSIEFIVDVIKINLKDEYKNVPVNSVRKLLSKEFEKYKSESYDKVKN